MGFAYIAPAAMTEGTWYLSWLAVAPEAQGRGLGTALLHGAEETIRLRQGRLLLVELSSQAAHDQARRFFRERGYETGAVLHDYFAEGQDLHVVGKRLLVPARQAEFSDSVAR